jgi:hypothetical protein
LIAKIWNWIGSGAVACKINDSVKLKRKERLIWFQFYYPFWCESSLLLWYQKFDLRWHHPVVYLSIKFLFVLWDKHNSVDLVCLVYIILLHSVGCPEISHHQKGHGYTRRVKGARPVITCSRFKVVVTLKTIINNMRLVYRLCY